jgi:serine/threonine-protein kinase
MLPERWRKVEEIFHAAIDCKPEERTRLLDSVCGDDAELRSEVESLLDYEVKHSTEICAFGDAVKVLEQRSTRVSEGLRIGAYRVLREIGRVGMGTVCLAARDDDEFQKLVAVKIIRRGLDTDDIIHRFRSERQILAMLDHPNIARLLDGGSTEDGLPYFVMEYIEGEPMDVYCDSHKLNVTERLRLFQGVCAAVSYAHQNLVIHRDIKPGNVLVRDGVPRLLDFGIAKLLSTELSGQAKTRTGVRPLTPEYASPEQVRGEVITTASDVYGLGALLYELLTGRSPLPCASQSELERAICEQEPERPSEAALRKGPEPGEGLPLLTPAAVSQVREGTPEKLRRRLQGDLDNIVLMALRKEPPRRYSSPAQLSEDIDRHLASLPVRARPDTRGYRAAKFIRRNKTWVAMAAVTFLSLAGGIAVSLHQMQVAKQQRDLARLEQAKAARINAFLQDMVGYSGVVGGTANHRIDATVAEMLDDAAGRVEKELADQPAVKAELLATIGRTYMVQARIQPAERFLKEAYDLNMNLYGPENLQTASVMFGLAGLAYRKGDYMGAEHWMDQAIPIYRTHAHDAGFEIRNLVASLSDAAFVKRAVGKLDEAEAMWRDALVYAPQIPDRYRGMRIAPKTFLAQLYLDRGDLERADPLAFEAVQELRALREDPFSLAQALIDLGNVRRLEARYTEADPLIREGTNLYATTQGDEHPNVAYGLLSLGTLHYYEGRYDLAELEGRRALAIVNQLPKGTNYYASSDELLGRTMIRTGRVREANAILREALALRQQNSHRPSDIAIAQGYLGECLIAEKRYAEAEPLLVESYHVLKNVHIAQSPVLREARERLTTLYSAWGKPSLAVQ